MIPASTCRAEVRAAPSHPSEVQYGFVLVIQLRGYLHEVFHGIEQVLQLVKGEDVRLMAGRTLINIRMKLTTMIHVSQLNQVAERKKK